MRYIMKSSSKMLFFGFAIIPIDWPLAFNVRHVNRTQQ
jgi:hypothetical protein